MISGGIAPSIQMSGIGTSALGLGGKPIAGSRALPCEPGRVFSRLICADCWERRPRVELSLLGFHSVRRLRRSSLVMFSAYCFGVQPSARVSSRHGPFMVTV